MPVRPDQIRPHEIPPGCSTNSVTGKDDPMRYPSVILRAHIEELLRSPNVDERDDELSDLLDAYIAASRRELDCPEDPDREHRLAFDESMGLTEEHISEALDLLRNV